MIFFKQMVMEQLGINKDSFNLYLVPYTKIISKWIIDLNVNATSVKLLEDLAIGKNFLARTLKALTIKEKN